MKCLNIILLMTLISCGAPKHVINSGALNSYQIKSDGPGSGESGKCYQKMKNETGKTEWYEIICPNRTNEYKVASECLRKLGYKLVDYSTFRTANGNALIDFQQNEQLVYGALDEATLKLLIQKSNYYE